ncbi:hypothetical protein ACFLYO_10535 [Chloroflexota bacterium]
MSTFEQTYPHITEWVKSWGWIEIGDDDMAGSFIRALDEGGLVWESDQTYPTLDDALQAMEAALADWMK